MLGAEHIRSRSSELLSLPSEIDNDCEGETEGEGQFESEIDVGESEVESVESESDVDHGEDCLKSDTQYYDTYRGVKNAEEIFVPASSSSPTDERTGTNSLQIVRIVDLGPSPINPSAVITEDRRYPCPHLGCPQVCKRRYDLERHLASKQHAPPRHTCDVCGLAFTRKDPLMRHQKASCKRIAP